VRVVEFDSGVTASGCGKVFDQGLVAERVMTEDYPDPYGSPD
jgi:hypothetical protein